MKLTEKQLAELFANNSKNNQATNLAGNCLNAMPASSARLSQAEDLLNDFNSAQGIKAAFATKQWSTAVANSIESSKKSWFGLLGPNSPFKPAIVTMAFAVAVVVAVPEFMQNQVTITPVQNEMVTDVINNMPFEEKNDVMSKVGFDAPPQSDALFDANFG